MHLIADERSVIAFCYAVLVVFVIRLRCHPTKHHQQIQNECHYQHRHVQKFSVAHQPACCRHSLHLQREIHYFYANFSDFMQQIVIIITLEFFLCISASFVKSHRFSFEKENNKNYELNCTTSVSGVESGDRAQFLRVKISSGHGLRLGEGYKWVGNF